MNSRIRAVARFAFLLGLVVWLGGLFFTAIGAPAMFKVSRELGPQMVGAALGRFTPISYICALLCLGGWLFDRTDFAHPAKSRAASGQWRLQGVCLAVMLVCAVYAGRAIMPEMQNMQPAVVASAAAGENNATRAQFDVLHKKYRAVTSTVVLLGLLSLGLFCARTARDENKSMVENDRT
ncbi:MAG TPA: DUF4149 domain-containing protein [Abditibacteriaceae bacterium]|jgi:hypothetical protein